MSPALITVLNPEQRDIYDSVRAFAADRGFDVYLIGGAVRDWLMGHPIGDLDFTVAQDAIDFAHSLAQALGGHVTSHERFRTATWSYAGHATDITTSRRETYPRPASLPVITPAPIERDFARRDFSINAMGLRLSDGVLFDLYDGQTDLSLKVIRALHDGSFIDDPTRILRAARYAARFGFTIEPATRQWLDAGLTYLKDLSGERVKYDIERTFDIAQPEDALNLLREWGAFNALGIVIPDKDLLVARFDAIRSRLRDWDDSPTALPSRDNVLMACWGALVYNLGQLSASRWLEWIPFTAGVREALVSLGVLSTLSAVQFTGKPSRQSELLQEFSEAALMVVWLFDSNSAKRAAAWHEWHSWRPVQPFTSGNDLRARAVAPGPIYRTLLTKLRAARLDGEVNTAAEERTLLEKLLAD
ncbi:MAG TPA: hypothetical protein VGK87_04785 [Anaerolineae bacterium]